MSEEQVNEIAVHSDTEIKGFFREYRFLSNFHKGSFIDREGVHWDSSEHFYQAKKSDSITIQESIRLAPLKKVKRMGRAIDPIRDGWEEGLKDEIMFEALVYKFTQNEEIKLQLIETGDRLLEEANWWRDTYWGTYDGNGQNKLGKQLMRLRQLLKWKDFNDQSD